MPITLVVYCLIALFVQEIVSSFASNHMTSMQAQNKKGHPWQLCNNLHWNEERSFGPTTTLCATFGFAVTT